MKGLISLLLWPWEAVRAPYMLASLNRTTSALNALVPVQRQSKIGLFDRLSPVSAVLLWVVGFVLSFRFGLAPGNSFSTLVIAVIITYAAGAVIAFVDLRWWPVSVLGRRIKEGMGLIFILLSYAFLLGAILGFFLVLILK